VSLSYKDCETVILTKAGGETQVYYGTGPMVRDPQSAKYRRTRLFVLTWASAANRFGCWCSGPVLKPGLSCTSGLFGGSVEQREWSCSTTCAKGIDCVAGRKAHHCAGRRWSNDYPLF
jgi:hypothetical protein